MPKTKIQEWDSTPSGNTDIDSVNIAEGCSPSGINNAIREVMAHVKTALSGADDKIVTGTAGTATNLAEWNADGDLVDAGVSVVDEDDMTSDSATALPTQQSVKAYVDASAVSVIDEDDMVSDSATRPPSQQSTKAYVDAQIAAAGSEWVRVNGSTGAIQAQGNGSWTTARSSTGTYTVDFTTAVPSRTGAGLIATTHTGGARSADASFSTTTRITVKTHSTNDNAVDCDFTVEIKRP